MKHPRIPSPRSPLTPFEPLTPATMHLRDGKRRAPAAWREPHPQPIDAPEPDEVAVAEWLEHVRFGRIEIS